MRGCTLLFQPKPFNVATFTCVAVTGPNRLQSVRKDYVMSAGFKNSWWHQEKVVHVSIWMLCV